MEYRTDCPASTIRDLKFFIQTYRQLKTATFINLEFQGIKDCWITKDMQTILQLSKANNVDAIGMPEYTSLAFYEDMLKGLIKANPKCNIKY